LRGIGKKRGSAGKTKLRGDRGIRKKKKEEGGDHVQYHDQTRKFIALTKLSGAG